MSETKFKLTYIHLKLTFVMYKIRTIAFLLMATLFVGCTTIEISERDAFDVHTTITPDRFHHPQYELRELTLETEDGEEIDSWYLKHENAEATVVYFGGNGFLMVKSAPLIDAYSEIPVNLMLIDYRGYGQSTGEPSVAGIQMDAKAAFEYAQYHSSSNSGNIFVHGHSMGSFLATLLTEEYSVDGYILESPITEVEGWTKNFVPWILRPFIRFDIDRALTRENNLERVQNIDTPLLVIGGSSDDITPFSMAEELHLKAASTQKELLEITGGTHNDLPNSHLYRRALEEFLLNSL